MGVIGFVRGVGFGVLAFALPLLMSAPIFPAAAETRQQRESCVNANEAETPDLEIQSCTAVIQSGQSNLAWAFTDRGNAYRNKGELDKAVADYNQALRLDPNYASAYYNRGGVYRTMRNFDAAIADFRAAIRLDERPARQKYGQEHSEGHVLMDREALANDYGGRGNAYNDKGDLDSALADYGRAIDIFPNSAWWHRSRGNLYYNKRDYDHAIADYNQAIRLGPNDAVALYWRGKAKQFNGDKPGGDADIAAAKKINPNLGD
jgi:tetratricopeptide (TPR) repeat protein